MATIYIIDSMDFIEGERYIINKPKNIMEWPNWNESFMEVLNGEECTIVEIERSSYRTKCIVNVEFPEDSYGHKRGYCNLKKSWLSKICDELQENDFDIKELF